MNAVDCEALSELFKVFADPSRIRILNFLFESGKCVHEISDSLEMTPSAVSHQLNTLRKSGLVKSKRSGKQVFYSLDDSHVEQILKCGIEHLYE